MKSILLLVVTLATVMAFNASAQTNSPTATPAAPPSNHKSAAIIPVKSGYLRSATTLAKDAPSDCDIEFIGDSITAWWQKKGTKYWMDFYNNKNRKSINMGLMGDGTQHVLWRFEHGQLDGVKAKVAVVLIGTNNSNTNKAGADMYSDADIVEGVTAVVDQIRRRQPDTKVLLLGIFPRGKTPDAQRDRLQKINLSLAKLDDGQQIFFLDIGAKFIEKDGSIAPEIMPDGLHLSGEGYRIWAVAMEPKLKQLLGE